MDVMRKMVSVTLLAGSSAALAQDDILYPANCTVAWDIVQGASGYRVEVNEEVSDVGNSLEASCAFLSMAGGQYELRVMAYNDVQESPWSQPITAFIGGLAAPTNIRLTVTPE